MTLAQSAAKIVQRIAPDAQAIFCRRRHQPSKASAELMFYLERAASALDVLSISGDADRPFAIYRL